MSNEALTWAWQQITAKDLSSGEGLVLVRIADGANSNGFFFEGKDKLQIQCNLKKRRLIDITYALQNKELMFVFAREREDESTGANIFWLRMVASEEPPDVETLNKLVKKKLELSGRIVAQRFQKKDGKGGCTPVHPPVQSSAPHPGCILVHPLVQPNAPTGVHSSAPAGCTPVHPGPVPSPVPIQDRYPPLATTLFSPAGSPNNNVFETYISEVGKIFAHLPGAIPSQTDRQIVERWFASKVAIPTVKLGLVEGMLRHISGPNYDRTLNLAYFVPIVDEYAKSPRAVPPHIVDFRYTRLPDYLKERPNFPRASWMIPELEEGPSS